METFKRVGYPSDNNVRVIVNRYHKNSVISLKEAEKGIEKRIFWQIPNDFQTTISAINQGKTLAAVTRKADITQNITELVSKVTLMADTQKAKKGIMGWQFLEAKT
jgi:pilus assembly protein CpaE